MGKLAGVRLGMSTNVGTTGAGATASYWVYVVGKGAVGAVNLGEASIASAERNPQVNILRHGPSASDPAGVIGGSVSYNFKFTSLRLKSTSDKERYRQIKALPSVTA